MHLYDSTAELVRNPFQSGAQYCTLLESQLWRAVLVERHQCKVFFCFTIQETRNGRVPALFLLLLHGR